VGFNIIHLGDSLPVRVLVSRQTFLGEKDFGTPKTGPYSGRQFWYRNPRTWYQGHFSIPKEAVTDTGRLRIRVRVTIVDQYERYHVLLPAAWVYKRDTDSWYPEP